MGIIRDRRRVINGVKVVRVPSESRPMTKAEEKSVYALLMATNSQFDLFPWVIDFWPSGEPVMCRCGRYAWFSKLDKRVHHYNYPERGCDHIAPELRSAAWERVAA